jgi:Sulfotransferase family
VIFCERFAFLHVPKTGGMSVTEYLLRLLPRPVYYTRKWDQRRHPVPEGVVDIDGKRHEILSEAREVVREHGFELSDFPVVAATLRNPYDLEVSRYTHFHRPYVAGRGNRSWEIAMNEDFAEFARQSPPHRGKGLERWFFLDGAMPDSMVVLRFEFLAADLQAALARAGIFATGSLPHKNVSRHDHFASYYTTDAEEAVYQKYKWVFDQGFYERLEVEDSAHARVHYGQKLPINGPVVQVGPSDGLWPDLWVGERLAFRVKAVAPVRAMTVSGRVEPEDRSVSLTVTVDGRSTTSTHEGEFVWTLPSVVESDARADIEVAADPNSWLHRPTAEFADRRVSFLLRHIAFAS